MANTYYFSVTSGSNTTGNGSQALPWGMGKGKIDGVQFLAAGDSCLFLCNDIWIGSSAELVIKSSGSALSHIVIGSWGSGAKPIFAGASITSSGWVATGISSIYVITSQTQAFLKTVTQSDSAGLGYWRGTSSNLPEGTFARFGSSLYVHLWNNENPATSNVRIANFAHSSTADGQRGLLSTSRTNGTQGACVDFVGLKVLCANGIGFSASASSNRFVNIVATGCGQEGVLFYAELLGSGENADGGRCVDSEISWNAAAGTGFGQGSTTYASNVWWNRCNVHDNFMAGVDFLDFSGQSQVIRSGVAFSTVTNNGRWQDVSGSFDANIYNDGGSQIYIYGNVVSGSGTVPGATNAREGIKIGSENVVASTATLIYIVNNLLYNNHWQGIGLDNAGSAVSNIKNVTICNNTVISYQAGAFDMCWNFADVDTTANNINMRNNVFISSGGIGNVTNLYTGTVDIPYLDSDYNLFFNVNNSANIYRSGDAGPIFYTLSSWTVVQNEDAHSLNSDPKCTLISDSSPDVHLGSASPGIGAGTAGAFIIPPWLPLDIFPYGGGIRGVARSDGTVDILGTDIGFHYLSDQSFGTSQYTGMQMPRGTKITISKNSQITMVAS